MSIRTHAPSGRKGFILRHAVEVPISAIQDGTADEVRLRYRADEVRALPEFVDAHDSASPTGFVPPIDYTRDSLLWPLGVPLLPPPPPRCDETAVRYDLNNTEISAGSDVISGDDKKIGEIHAVTLDPTTAGPATLTVRRGFLFTDEVEFPVELIRDVDDGVIFIDVDAEEASAYAHANAPFRPGWAH